MTKFIRPQVTVEPVNDNFARFIVEPLERGYGQTLGNSMRRVLLSSLTGAAVTAIKIDGVQHEFTAPEGVVEDVTDIVLNVKGLVFSSLESAEEATATISATGPCVVTGADMHVPAEFTLINPEHVICELAEGGSIEMSLTIATGRGYVSAEHNKCVDDPIGLIRTDSLFSPIKRCAMNVENTRRGQITDYDRLVLEVETNGAITANNAVVAAAGIVIQHMEAFMALSEDVEDVPAESIFAPEGPSKNFELDKRVEELELSVRSYNCLKRAGIHSVRQLIDFSENDLFNIRNFGAKSIEEVKDKLISMGLNLKQ